MSVQWRGNVLNRLRTPSGVGTGRTVDLVLECKKPKWVFKHAERLQARFVAIIGAPNAGKSTLLNQLVGSKVAIVTHKVQTTRARIRGIAMEGDTQIVFVDTPGIFKPKRRLDKAMVEAAWGGAGDADLIILMVDAEHERAEDLERILEGLKEQGRKAILVLNKVDKAKKEPLLALAQDVEKVVFDKGGHLYHGRVAAVADGARAGGLDF